MSIFVIILLIFLGLLLLMIEFAVIPGITIAGIGGFLLLGASVYIAFVEYGSLAGFITLAVVLIAAPLMIYYFFKSRAGKKMTLETKITGKVETFVHEKINIGDIGKTIGRLAPMGKVKINGETIEAKSNGSFIDHNTEIEVLKILANSIIVEPKNLES
ncbi:MAG: NfeD family protein [Mariniphaga sp.]|nr:NfeD family protein [Mariniphaga sp.]